MKKNLALLLAAVMAFSMLAGCGGKKTDPAGSSPAVSTPAVSQPAGSAASSADPSTEQAEAVKVMVMSGPTGVGAARMMSAEVVNPDPKFVYDYSVVTDNSEVMNALINKDADIAAVATNVAANLVNKTDGGIQVLAVNTLGVLYILEKGGETIQSVADLKGKTIYATGKGNTPEYSLAYLLSQNGLDIASDVTMEWKSEASEVVAQMATLDTAVALLPQPYVTVAQTKVEGLRVALDMTAEWATVGSTLITGGLIIRTAFLEEHPEAVATFLEEYAASTQYVNENVEEAAALVEQYIGVAAGVAKKAIPACNIVCLTGEEMKAAAEKYLTVLFELNPDAVGGAMPGEGFYYLP